MALDDDKFNRKNYMEGAHYAPALLTDVSITDGTTTYIIPHDADTIVFAKSAVSIHDVGATNIRFRSYTLTYNEAECIIFNINKINYDIQYHLWDKYAEIDACTTTEQVNAVVWEYNITQLYTLDTNVVKQSYSNLIDRPYIPGESQVRAWVNEVFQEKGL